LPRAGGFTPCEKRWMVWCSRNRERRVLRSPS
jgi:hypothetical protein